MSTQIYTLDQRVFDLRDRLGTPSDLEGSSEYASFFSDRMDCSENDANNEIGMFETAKLERREKYKNMGLKLRSTPKAPTSPHFASHEVDQNNSTLPSFMSPIIPSRYDHVSPEKPIPEEMLSPTLPQRFEAIPLILQSSQECLHSHPSTRGSVKLVKILIKTEASLLVSLRFPSQQEKAPASIARGKPINQLHTEEDCYDAAAETTTKRSQMLSDIAVTPEIRERPVQISLESEKGDTRFRFSPSHTPSVLPVQKFEGLRALKERLTEMKDANSLKDEFNRFTALGRQLKHSGDEMMKTDTVCGTLLGTESVLYGHFGI